MLNHKSHVCANISLPIRWFKFDSHSSHRFEIWCIECIRWDKLYATVQMDAPTLIGEKESTGGEKIRGKNISISHSKKQVEKPIRTSGTKYTLAGLSPDILFHKSHHHVYLTAWWWCGTETLIKSEYLAWKQSHWKKRLRIRQLIVRCVCVLGGPLSRCKLPTKITIPPSCKMNESSCRLIFISL